MKKSSENKNNLITYGIVVAAFLFVCILIWTGNASRHLKAMLVPIGINIILAVSLNLIVGFLGELTLGHAGFMSVGAYAGCLFAIKYADVLPTVIRFPLAMVIGGLVASVFGIIIGVPVLRLKGDYLAIVTLAFGEIIRSVIINLEFTGGAAGLKGTPQDTNIYIVFAVIMIMLVVIINLVNSRAGRAICSIRDNRIAAESIGINITYYKLLAFVVAAFFAGVAGVIYGHNLSILQASVFDYNRSIEILVIVVLGGMGSIRGSVIAATIITALPEMLRGADKFRMLIYAVVLIAMMLLNGSSRFDKYKGRMNIGGLFSLIKNRKSAKEAG
jgi:branched-chain amino acid transport system permease protein